MLLEPSSLQHPFQPKPFYDSETMILCLPAFEQGMLVEHITITHEK